MVRYTASELLRTSESYRAIWVLTKSAPNRGVSNYYEILRLEAESCHKLHSQLHRLPQSPYIA